MLMRQCWASNPEDRSSGFDEVVQRLEAVLGGVEAADEEGGVYCDNPMHEEGVEQQVAATSTDHILSIQAHDNPMLAQLDRAGFRAVQLVVGDTN
jgi:hypothetical protein